jgi:hypothetical protein
LPTPVIPSNRIFTSSRIKEETKMSNAVISRLDPFVRLLFPFRKLTST